MVLVHPCSLILNNDPAAAGNDITLQSSKTGYSCCGVEEIYEILTTSSIDKKSLLVVEA